MTEPHCKHCGNPYVEKTVEVCSWPCLHNLLQERRAANCAHDHENITDNGVVLRAVCVQCGNATVLAERSAT